MCVNKSQRIKLLCTPGRPYPRRAITIVVNGIHSSFQYQKANCYVFACQSYIPLSDSIKGDNIVNNHVTLRPPLSLKSSNPLSHILHSKARHSLLHPTPENDRPWFKHAQFASKALSLLLNLQNTSLLM